MAIADNLKGLHHWNTGRHHGCELPGEYRDIRRQNFAAGSERGAWRLDASGSNTLASQVGSPRCFARCKRLAVYSVAALVLTFPQKLGFFLACGCRYRHKSDPSGYLLIDGDA